MSFVATLTTDHGAVQNPSWEQVKAAIAALDAERTALVVLSPAPPKGAPVGDYHMAIGGGKDDLCVVYSTEDNLRFWNLRDTSKADSTLRVMTLVGGQEGEYREDQCVPKAWAVRAAESYFADGTRAADLEWIET